MGYHTEFEGGFNIEPPIDRLSHFMELKKVHDTRHEPSTGRPGYYCQWAVTEDGSRLEWDGQEKFYDYVEWLKWLIENYFLPWQHVLNGSVEWWGEDRADRGKIVVENNVVKILRLQATWVEDQ